MVVTRASLNCVSLPPRLQEEDAASGSEEEEQSEEDEDHDAGGLLVKLDQGRAGVAKSGAAMAAQWFKQDLFKVGHT